MYAARVCATNAAGEKVYSDFSNVLEVVRTPEIEVSDVVNGKATVSIKNKDDYSLVCIIGGQLKSCTGYKVYTTGGAELKTVNSVSDNAIIDVETSMDIYVKTFDTFGQIEDSVYSAQSNVINVHK